MRARRGRAAPGAGLRSRRVQVGGAVLLSGWGAEATAAFRVWSTG